MRNLIYFLSLLIIFLTTNCSEKKDFTLKGKIEGLPSDTILIFYQVPEYNLDTLVCKNGVFEYSFIPDTLTVFSLVFNEQENLPIFAEKGHTVEISGSINEGITIKGKGENKLMNDIISLLKRVPTPEIKHITDSLISTNNDSFTNLYLINKYYAQENSPNYELMRKLFDKLSGNIKDTPYMITLQTRMEYLSAKNRNNIIHSLQGKDRDGKDIKWGTIRDKYILLDFWASWHPQSVAEQDSLETVLKALKKEDFIIVSMSLDLDKEAWLKASDRDTTQWKQICDFSGWNNNIIENHGIQSLPYNLLLAPNKRIVERNIRGQELITKVKELSATNKKKNKKKTTK